MRTIFILSLLLAMSPAVSGSSAATAELYQSNCSVCHGDAGDGASHASQGLNPPPRDFTAPAYAQTSSRETIATFIRNGKPGTAMIAWQTVLSPQDIDELADYIVTKFVAPAQPKKTDLDKAFVLYQENCSVCHGDDGMGAVWGQESLASAPRNFRSEASRRELNRERMIAAVSFGRPGTPMPGFGTQLEPTQIGAVVDYVRKTFMADESTQAGEFAREDHFASGEYQSLPIPGELVGNPARGNAFYVANCVTCHGIEGDGDGPRAYFIFPRPRNFLDPATREILNRPRLFAGIKQGVIGKEMPAWGKVLNDQDIADITEYVYGMFIRPSE
ncbi:MAG: c-type cytochrome [Chromatiales bacterium]|nr:MAG: c-type cytochrome [Chromatiales bacterium]